MARLSMFVSGDVWVDRPKQCEWKRLYRVFGENERFWSSRLWGQHSWFLGQANQLRLMRSGLWCYEVTRLWGQCYEVLGQGLGNNVQGSRFKVLRFLEAGWCLGRSTQTMCLEARIFQKDCLSISGFREFRGFRGHGSYDVWVGRPKQCGLDHA